MKHRLDVDQIKKLWILDLIIQTGSLKAAAARARISASAVSQSLAALEKHVGKPLVIRSHGSALATQDALAILEIVRPAFEAFYRLDHLGSQPVPQMKWLNFGAYESLAVEVLPALIDRLRKQLPNLKLGLRISRTGQLLKMVRNGELCSAIITEVDDLETFYKVPVASDRLGVFVAARYERKSRGNQLIQKLGLGALAPYQNGLPRYYNRFLKRLGPLQPTVLSESFETLRAASVSGVLASILPLRVASRNSGLVEITPAGDDKSSGSHQIFVVSQSHCDKEEVDFLAQEIKLILQSRSLKSTEH